MSCNTISSSQNSSVLGGSEEAQALDAELLKMGYLGLDKKEVVWINTDHKAQKFSFLKRFCVWIASFFKCDQFLIRYFAPYRESAETLARLKDRVIALSEYHGDLYKHYNTCINLFKKTFDIRDEADREMFSRLNTIDLDSVQRPSERESNPSEANSTYRVPSFSPSAASSSIQASSEAWEGENVIGQELDIAAFKLHSIGSPEKLSINGKKKDKRFDDFTALTNGMYTRYVPVRGDGNCFVNSLAAALVMMSDKDAAVLEKVRAVLFENFDEPSAHGYVTPDTSETAPEYSRMFTRQGDYEEVLRKFERKTQSQLISDNSFYAAFSRILRELLHKAVPQSVSLETGKNIDGLAIYAVNHIFSLNAIVWTMDKAHLPDSHAQVLFGAAEDWNQLSVTLDLTTGQIQDSHGILGGEAATKDFQNRVIRALEMNSFALILNSGHYDLSFRRDAKA